MLIKKADVKNHLAAKLRKRRLLQSSISSQIPAGHSSAANLGTVAIGGESVQEPLSPASEFALPIRSSNGH